jgi:peptide/nickel transport system permease protein
MTSRAESQRKEARSRPVVLLFRLFKEKPLGAFGLVVTLALLLTGILADLLAPYEMNQIHTTHRLEPPSAEFLLGTDRASWPTSLHRTR